MPANLDELLVEIRTLRREIRYLHLTIEASQGGPIAGPNDMVDPFIRFDPREWKGPKFKRKKMTDCPPEFLDSYARALAGMAEHERAAKRTFNGKETWRYTLLDASRARRWALRKRTGWEPPEKPAVTASPFDEDDETFARFSDEKDYPNDAEKPGARPLPHHHDEDEDELGF